MGRDEFRCLKCGNDKATLTVHHRLYIWGREPWEYSDEILATLCQSCHNEEHDCDDAAKDLVPILKARGFFNTDIAAFASVLHSMPLVYPADVVVAALSATLNSDEGMRNFMEAYFSDLSGGRHAENQNH